MKTVYAQVDYGKVTLKEGVLPRIGPRQVLLESLYSSISAGTELEFMLGKAPLPLPQSIGYSMIAKVAGAGADVTLLKEGDIVAATAKHADYNVVDERVCTLVPDGADLEQAAFFILAHTSLYGIRRTKLRLGESAVVLGQGLVGLFAAQLAVIAGACPVIVTARDDYRLGFSKKIGVDHAVNIKSRPDEIGRAHV
jgi:threonine dehydrogenase-like Zn-dependent dehydrogenase